MPPNPDYKQMKAPVPVTKHTLFEPCKCDLCQVARTSLMQDTAEALAKTVFQSLPAQSSSSSSKPSANVQTK